MLFHQVIVFLFLFCLEGIKAVSYINPVYSNDFPDPFVLAHGGLYYSFSTNSGGLRIPCMVSNDPTKWSKPKECLANVPHWSPSPYFIWAPSILAVNNSFFVMYYATRCPLNDGQAISIGVSKSPQGPYYDLTSQPFIWQHELGGSIDPSPVVDSDGSKYLVWKSDGNNNGSPSRIWAQRLSDDGLHLIGTASELIQNDQKWEYTVVEGPSMIKHNSHYFLFYSANGYNSYLYAIGFARCKTVMGPCEKPVFSPIMSFYSDVWGPGGSEFFLFNNKLFVCYHAWTSPFDSYTAGGKRSLRIDEVTFITRNNVGIVPVVQVSDWNQTVTF